MPAYLSPGVYVEEVEAGSRPIEGVGTAVAGFVGFAADGPFNTPTLVTNWSQFTQTFGDFVEGAYLPHAVFGYFMNGGGSCYVVRVGDGTSSNGHGGDDEARQLMRRPAASLGPYVVRAIEAAPSAKITVEVTDAGKNGNGEPPADDSFKLVIKQAGKVVEEFDGLTTAKGRQNIATLVSAKSQLLSIDEPTSGAALEKPAKGTVTLVAPELPPAEPVPVKPEHYVGNSADRTGFSGREAVDEITSVCVPDLVAAYQNGSVNLEGFKAVQLAMIAHCELMGDRVAILDPPHGLDAQKIKKWRVEEAAYDSKYAALYWPQIKVSDPLTGGSIHIPPSGHMAGVWARSDNERGVHKAPANEVIRGVLSPELQITKAEHDLLNPHGINVLRSFPGRGVRVWGARTLSSDPAWRYLNVRRLFNYLEESLLAGTQWVVFEPNDNALWAKIRRTIASFLVMEWRKGALFGLTPDEAFYVKCDDETNPAESIDLGQVVCEIGIAPVKPAEFVVFRLAQFSGGTSLVNE
jgi:phage tail sheath protein FI